MHRTHTKTLPFCCLISLCVQKFCTAEQTSFKKQKIAGLTPVFPVILITVQLNYGFKKRVTVLLSMIVGSIRGFCTEWNIMTEPVSTGSFWAI